MSIHSCQGFTDSRENSPSSVFISGVFHLFRCPGGKSIVRLMTSVTPVCLNSFLGLMVFAICWQCVSRSRFQSSRVGVPLNDAIRMTEPNPSAAALFARFV